MKGKLANTQVHNNNLDTMLLLLQCCSSICLFCMSSLFLYVKGSTGTHAWNKLYIGIIYQDRKSLTCACLFVIVKIMSLSHNSQGDKGDQGYKGDTGPSAPTGKSIKEGIIAYEEYYHQKCVINMSCRSRGLSSNPISSVYFVMVKIRR